MGFLKDLVKKIAESPGNETVTKFDPFADAITNTLTEATETGWGKPLGSEKSGPDVIGGRFTNELWRGYGGDPDEARDRRVGRTVGSLFAGYGLNSAFGGSSSAGSSGSGSGSGSGLFSGLFSGGGSGAAGGGMWGNIIGGALSLVGGALGAKGADDAAEKQAEATREGIAEQRRQFDLIRSDLTPYREAGSDAIMRLSDLLGRGRADGLETSPLLRRFSVADFWSDPVAQLGYQSGLDLGTKALRNAAPLTTGIDSGAAIKELTKFGTDYTGAKAGESYGRFVGDQTNQFNRMAALSGIGQTANQTSAGAGVATGTNVAGMLTAQGNANAAAQIAKSNAYTNSLSSVANWWQQQQLLDRLNSGTNRYYTGYDYAGGPAYG